MKSIDFVSGTREGSSIDRLALKCFVDVYLSCPALLHLIQRELGARLSETYQRSVDGHSANTTLILSKRITEQNHRDVCLALARAVSVAGVAYLRREADKAAAASSLFASQHTCTQTEGTCHRTRNNHSKYVSA